MIRVKRIKGLNNKTLRLAVRSLPDRREAAAFGPMFDFLAISSLTAKEHFIKAYKQEIRRGN